MANTAQIIRLHQYNDATVELYPINKPECVIDELGVALPKKLPTILTTGEVSGEDSLILKADASTILCSTPLANIGLGSDFFKVEEDGVFIVDEHFNVGVDLSLGVSGGSGTSAEVESRLSRIESVLGNLLDNNVSMTYTD